MRIAPLLALPVLVMAADDPRPLHTLPKLAAVTVDGSATDWSDQGLVIRAFAEDGERPTAPDLLKAEARVAWNDQGVAVFVQVRSSAPVREARDALHGYEADSVELFLRQGSAWKRLVQPMVTPGLRSESDEPRLHVWDYRGKDQEWSTPPSATVARNRQPGGYDLEVLIPWTNLDLTPQAGLGCELRLQVNKVLPEVGRRQMIWRGPNGEDFHRIELGETAGSAIEAAAWLTLDEPRGISVAAVAPAGTTGPLEVRHPDGRTLTVPFESRNERSEAWVGIPLSWAGKPLSLSIDGTAIGGGTVQDPAPLLRDAMILGSRTWRGGSDGRVARMTPRIPAVLTGDDLPQATWSDPASAALAGVTGMTTRWFAADFNEVTEAKTPGRYGAVTTVTLGEGDPVTFHQTAVRLSDDEIAAWAAGTGTALGVVDAEARQDLARRLIPTLADSRDLAVILAAARDGAETLRPTSQDRAWWHHLRTKLGTQTVYQYHRLLPKGYDEDPQKKWPAVIYLHGNGGRLPRDYPPFTQRDPNRDLYGWAKGKGDIPFVIYPLASFGGWESEAVLDTVDKILSEDRIDPDRLIIMGFSMGGMGTWTCAVDHPERWAAAVPIGGRGSYADEAARVKDLPVWVFNGDADTTTTLADAQKIVDALKAIGGNVRLTVLPGIGHGGSQNGTFETPGLWEWLAEQRRSATP